MLQVPMTPAAALRTELLDALENSPPPDAPWVELLPRVLDALKDLDERQQQPQFRAIPRVK